MAKKDTHIGIDSQCLSYLLDAVTEVIEPTDALAIERKALIRLWFYRPETYYVTPTVVKECEKIRDMERKQFHQSCIDSLFCDSRIRDGAYVQARTADLVRLHSRIADCQILAEAEEIGLNVLLSYDHKFLRRLGQASQVVILTSPSAYWDRLQLQPGTRPQTVPHHTNPLSAETWWRW